ncbi:MAG: cytoplasmic protein [Desulfamplus sp.]|nr:cytoplasmic protein [Desulfamplus sp.]
MNSLENATSQQESHNFIHQYKGLGAFGMDRTTDEETIMFYLQKFSEDRFMKVFVPRLKDEELENLYNIINSLLKKHFSEDEYHSLFLKDR